MKKLILILAVMTIGLMASAQTTWTTNLIWQDDQSGSLWGTGTHDTTLTSSITTQYLIRAKSASVLDLSFQITLTKVSGTVTGTKVVFEGSNNGTLFVAIDSVQLAGDATATHYKNIDDFNYSYLRVKGVGVGTSGKCKLDAWYSVRKE